MNDERKVLVCEKRFFEIYGKDCDGVAFCPYRVCPIGAHVDHQLGKITGLALDKGVSMAYRQKKNGVVEISSLNFSNRAQWHILSTPKIRENDWADHLRGATIALAKRHVLEVGVCGVIEGELPIGGLSSSASVIIAFVLALAKVNKITLSPEEMIEIALEAENKYVGVSCGKLDQSCEVYSKKDHLLYLDTKDESFELVPTNPQMKPYKIAVFFSGMERSLAGSKYNMRVDECRAVAYAIKSFSGQEYGKFDQTYLRDIPEEMFAKYKSRLPEAWVKRAEHYYSEISRVEKGVELWRKGDLDGFGKLTFESGYSSIYNYQTGSEELKTLYEIMKKTDGVYGGRFSGAGFKGCCMAFIDPSLEQNVIKAVTDEYLRAHPQYKGKYSVHICVSDDGVQL